MPASEPLPEPETLQAAEVSTLMSTCEPSMSMVEPALQLSAPFALISMF